MKKIKLFSLFIFSLAVLFATFFLAKESWASHRGGLGTASGVSISTSASGSGTAPNGSISVNVSLNNNYTNYYWAIYLEGHVGSTFQNSGWLYRMGTGVNNTFTFNNLNAGIYPTSGDALLYYWSSNTQKYEYWATLSIGGPSGWTFCANEGGTCSFSGTKFVRYGANNVYSFGTYTNAVSCSNDTFGDPISGVRKTCQYNNSSSDIIINNPTPVITPTAEGNASIIPYQQQTVNYNTTKTFSITVPTGYTASVGGTCPSGSWSGNNYTTGSITANCTVIAKSTINTFTLTSSAGANGSITPVGPTVKSYGSSQTYTVTPSANYHITSVLVDGSSVAVFNGSSDSSPYSYTLSNITANHTIYATFAINTYIVNVATYVNGGTVSPSTVQTVDSNSTKTYTITPNAGYKAKAYGESSGCDGSPTSTQSSSYTYTTGPITGSCTVYVVFISGTLTPASSSCIISAGASSCDINFSWNVINATGANPSTITSDYPNVGTTIATGNSGGPTAFAVPKLSSPRTFYLNNYGILLTQSAVSSDCATNTTWNGSVCVLNTLTASLSASPTTGTGDTAVTLSASPGGTATGSMNYNFWYNCNSSATTVSATQSSPITGCGTLTAPPYPNSCTETANVGYKCNGVTTNPKSIPAHTYTPGTYTPKVIIERGSVLSAEDRTASFTINSAFAYTLARTAPSITALRGEAGVTNTITVSKTAGTAAAVTLSASGLPSGVTSSFSPASCTPNTTCTSALTLTASSVATAGTYTITVSGSPSSGTTSFSLVVSNPTLSATLSASPTTGTGDTAVTLTATPSGTASGSMNYNFWYNCNSSATTVSGTQSSPITGCGTLTAPPYPNSCIQTTGVGYKCNGVNTIPQNVPSHIYTPGTYTPKVIIERGSAPSAEDRTTAFTIQPAVSTVNVSVTPTTVFHDNPFTLNWSSSGASSCSINQGIGVVTANQSSSRNLTAPSYTSASGAITTITYTITCSNSAGVNSTSSATVTVDNFDYSFDSWSGAVAPVVPQGTSITKTVRITRNKGNPQNVSFSASNLPYQTSASFSPVSCSPNPTDCTSTMTLSTGPSTPVGTYTINVYGSPLNKSIGFTFNSVVPTLSATLSATPTSGTSDTSVVLSATPSGNVSGTMNYSFWYNCNSTSTTVGGVNTSAGAGCVALTNNCTPNDIGYKCDGVTTDPKSIPAHIYTAPGTYTPKVIIERSTAPSAEDRQTVTINLPVPTATLQVSNNPNGGYGSSASISYNNAAYLKWSSTNAGSCSISPTISGSIGTSDSVRSTGNLTQTQIYTLTCFTGANGMGVSVTDTITVNVAAPTLGVNFTITPASGSSPLDTTFSSSVTGQALGTINYSFWWDCSNTGTNVSGVESLCGYLPQQVPNNSCVANAKGYKCVGVNTNPQSTTHQYTCASGTCSYNAKVIVERGTAVNVEDRKSVSVTVPNLTASCTVDKSITTKGERATWGAVASGGTGTYTYSWGGSAPLAGGVGPLVIVTGYSTSGTKTGSVTVTSGSQTKTVNCSNSVTVYSPGIDISPSSSSVIPIHIKVDDTKQLAVDYYPYGITNTTGVLDITNSASWSSNDITKVSVSNTSPTKGLVTGESISFTNINVNSSYTDQYGNSLVTSAFVKVDDRALLSCSPSSSNISVGQNITFNALGGTQSFIWSTQNNSGSPASGAGSSFTTKFNTSGTYDVTVSSGRQLVICTTIVSSPSVTIIDPLILTPSPGNAIAPVNGVDISAAITSNVTDTSNFTFYCNRSDAGTNITTGYAAKYDTVSASIMGKTAVDACNYTTPGTYTAKVIVQRGSAVAERRSTFTVLQQVTVDLKVAGLDGPITIDSDTSATLSWVTTNATACNASGGTGLNWSGSKPIGAPTSYSQSTGILSVPGTYRFTLTCTGTNSRSGSDYVDIIVSPSLKIDSFKVVPPGKSTADTGNDLEVYVSSNLADVNNNYTFYCNKPGPDSDIVITTDWDYKQDGEPAMNYITPSYTCSYILPGTYTAKVIVERGGITRAAHVDTVISSNVAPTVDALPPLEPSDYCASPFGWALNWDFLDDNGDTQNAYQVVITDQGTGNVVKDTGKVVSSSGSYNVLLGTLDFNKTYDWKVTVWESDLERLSAQADGQSFTTIKHSAPALSFSMAPTRPSKDEQVTLTDTTTTSGGATKVAWDWDFSNVDGVSLLGPTNEPTVLLSFTTSGAKNGVLSVTDSDDLVCTKSFSNVSGNRVISIGRGLPSFQEIIPR